MGFFRVTNFWLAFKLQIKLVLLFFWCFFWLYIDVCALIGLATGRIEKNGKNGTTDYNLVTNTKMEVLAFLVRAFIFFLLRRQIFV